MSEIKVGIGVVILNPQGRILAGKRLASHGADTWSLVGGHLEFGESFEECARRETMEEAGLELQDIRVLSVANHTFDNGRKHYVTIYMIGRVNDDPPQIREPDKIGEWQYFDSLAAIPHSHFVPYLNDVAQKTIDIYLNNQAK